MIYTIKRQYQQLQIVTKYYYQTLKSANISKTKIIPTSRKRKYCNMFSFAVLSSAWLQQHCVKSWEQLTYLWCTTEVTHHLSYVLHNSHIVFPAVIPKLRGRELPLQNDSRPFKIRQQKHKLIIS